MTDTIDAPANLYALAPVEQDALDRCEAVIARGVQTFIEVGEALTEIRDQMLYRFSHKSFDHYCKERWGIGRARAYQLMDAAPIARELSTQVDTPPTNEREARAVAKASPADRPAVIARADQLAGDAPRTAKHIEAAVAEIAETELPIDFAIVQRRLATHGVTLTHKGGTFNLLDRDGAESRTRVWDQVLDRLALIEAAPSPGASAPAFRMTCPTCGETILNGIWGDRKECGSCYHARVRSPPRPRWPSWTPRCPPT